MPKTFIRSLTGKVRTRHADIKLGVILAFIAGAINAGGLMAVGEYTSHMTGIVSAIADYVVLYKIKAALAALAFLFSFVAGATISAIIINWARQREMHAEFAMPLMLEALLLSLFGIAATNASSTSVSLIVPLLCFIMGLQNAIITKISNSEIRTTHVTGLATDIGIEIGKYFYFHGEQNGNVTMNLHKLKVHASLLFSFLVGGIIGAAAFKMFGFVTTIPFALLLAVLASVPLMDDFKSAP
jgi:uncharacterized membrane protein YoaK (UPF0700 family)